jgi:hypothetical protein
VGHSLLMWRATYYPALLFAHAQHRVALRRIAALDTPYWALWFAFWLPLRAVAVALLRIAEWSAA